MEFLKWLEDDPSSAKLFLFLFTVLVIAAVILGMTAIIVHGS